MLKLATQNHRNWSTDSEITCESEIYSQRNTHGHTSGFLEKSSASPYPKQEGHEGPLTLYVCHRDVCIHLSHGGLLYLMETNRLVWDVISLTYFHGLLCGDMNHSLLRSTSSFPRTEKEGQTISFSVDVYNMLNYVNSL